MKARAAMMDDSLKVERVATLLRTSHWDADLSLLVSLLGEPSILDGTNWAQFDTASGRVCLGPSGELSEGWAVMLKVSDLALARQWVLEHGYEVGAQTQGAHEEQLEARTPGGALLIFYRPL
jgi:hypothetical protein